MTDTTTLAPTDAELHDLADRCTPNTETGSLNYRAFAHALLAKWGAPAPASHEALTTALAACRDAFPVPASGSAAEFEWQGAMTDPLGVPAYVRACAAPPAQEARDGCTLSSRIAELTEQHGSLRAAARSLDFDPGYLARLQSGEKCNPSPALLERLGLRQVITYERGTT